LYNEKLVTSVEFVLFELRTKLKKNNKY